MLPGGPFSHPGFRSGFGVRDASAIAVPCLHQIHLASIWMSVGVCDSIRCVEWRRIFGVPVIILSKTNSPFAVWLLFDVGKKVVKKV